MIVYFIHSRRVIVVGKTSIRQELEFQDQGICIILKAKIYHRQTPLFPEVPVIRIFIFNKNERSFINLQLCQ